jgi:hypothetical protein
MISKAPRPPILADRIGRAGNFEGFGDSFNPQPSNIEEQRQADTRVAIAWPIAGVRTPRNVVSRLVGMMEIAQARAFALQGSRAFECPKSSAAIHEAGHAVFYAQSGVFPSKITILPIIVSSEQRWIGKTFGVPKSRVDATTSAQDDLKTGQNLASGVIAECLFDFEYRAGSSLDEIVLAIAVVGSAAIKLQSDAEILWLKTLNEVATILKANEVAVHKIADELMRKRMICSHRIACLLRDVKRVGDEK